jgi:hypothetical protein
VDREKGAKNAWRANAPVGDTWRDGVGVPEGVVSVDMGNGCGRRSGVNDVVLVVYGVVCCAIALCCCSARGPAPTPGGGGGWDAGDRTTTPEDKIRSLSDGNPEPLLLLLLLLLVVDFFMPSDPDSRKRLVVEATHECCVSCCSATPVGLWDGDTIGVVILLWNDIGTGAASVCCA